MSAPTITLTSTFAPDSTFALQGGYTESMPTTQSPATARIDVTMRALADAQQAARLAYTKFGINETAEVIAKANADADYQTVLDVARGVAVRAGKSDTMWERILLDFVRAENIPAPTRRSAAQIAEDRESIVDYVAAQQERRHGSEVPTRPWMRAADLTALVKAGRLERNVRKEYDRQQGHAANMFGGAGVMARQRAYLRLVTA